MRWARNGDRGAALTEVCNTGVRQARGYSAISYNRASAHRHLLNLTGLINFALERGYIVENETGRAAGDHEIAPTPFAQNAAGVFPRHAGHRRQIGVADLLVEYNGLRARRRSDEFR